MHTAHVKNSNCLETPKVSILVPCYNVERFLPKCLESLVSQTLRDIEIICINDGSTDSTLSIIEEFKNRDNRIRVINKSNSGYGASMNQGLDFARGEYIGITESDDFASPSMYEKLYRVARKHDLDIAKSNFYNFYNGEDHKEEVFKSFPYKKVFDPVDVPHILALTPSIWAAVYRRSMIGDAGIRFNETPGASFQDTAFVIKCWFAARRAYLVPQAFLHYRNDNPNSSVKSSTKIYEICDEFASADAFMSSDLARRERFIAELNGHRFNTYRWNYNRIAEEYHMEFAARIKKDMLRAQEHGELLEEGFSPENWKWVQAILRDSEQFVRVHPEQFEIEIPQPSRHWEPFDIKLFVSCCEDTYVPDLPFIVPVQVGTTCNGGRFEGYAHDNDGDNISLKHMVFRDLTTQYWAWKNVSADYYGFMQDRRYLEFIESGKPSDECGVVSYGLLDSTSFAEMGYCGSVIAAQVEKYDIIIGGRYRLVGEDETQGIRSWYANDWRKNGKDLDRLMEIVRHRFPDYVEDADAYLAGDWILPFNVFVMNRSYFHEYAEFAFSCLLEFAEAIDENAVSSFAARAPEFLSIHLLGIYLNHCRRVDSAVRILYARNGYFGSADKPYLEPAFRERNCPVVFSSSDEYSVFAGVAIQSIIDNSSPDVNYDIIVLDTGMRDASRMLLRRQLKDLPNFSLRFLDIELQLKTRKLPSAYHITIGTFGRFLTLDYLVGFDKVVYLDCDLVVNRDINELYSVDIGDCLIGAVRDTAGNGWYNIPGNEMRQHMDDVLEITEPCGYFNAGVLVMNLAELRKVTTCDKLMQLAVDPKWVWLDQDVLNHVCRGRIKYLDQAWNYMAHKESYAMPQSLPEVWLPNWLQRAYYEAQKSPSIVHYVGHSIPCFAPEADCYWYFWKYARASLFYERILKIAMSETVAQEQMSTRVHARQAVKGVKEIIKNKLGWVVRRKHVRSKGV